MTVNKIEKKREVSKYDIIFLLSLFLIGFIATFSYGFYLDQDSEQKILFSNIKEYSHVNSKLYQDLDAGGTISIEENVDKDHGIAVYYPVFFIWYLNQSNPYLGSVVWHLYTYIFIFAIGCCTLYFLTKKMFKSKYIATITTLLFFFTPRIFAEMHYNNKDVVLLALLFACFYWGWLLIEKCSWLNCIMFALIGALAFNMKVVGACYFGLVGIYVLFHYISKKRMNKNIVIKICACILMWFGIYILLTPASWSGIIAFFKYLIDYAVNYERWQGYILYNGKLIHTTYTGIPHKYLPTMILLTVPVGILITIAMGYSLLFIDMIKGKMKKMFEVEGYVFLIALSGLIPLAYAVLAQTPVYNAWRHFYFVYATMIICGGYGIYRIMNMIKKESLKKTLKYGGIVYICVLGVSIMLNHPQEHSYYNLLAGENVEATFELDYWDLSVWQAYKIIYKEAINGDKPVTVSTVNTLIMWGLEGNWDVLPEHIKNKIEVIEEWEEAEYIIMNTTYGIMYSPQEYEAIKQQYTLVSTIESYGNPVCEIYRRN